MVTTTHITVITIITTTTTTRRVLRSIVRSPVMATTTARMVDMDI